jgi:YVTN family beta-propeller protein
MSNVRRRWPATLALALFAQFAWVLALQAAPTPKPALLVLNKAEATMVIVDPATGTVLATIGTGEGPHEVATDGVHAFVANYGAQTPGNSLSIVELATQREIKRVDLGALRRPHGIVLVEGKGYFTAETNRAVARYDPASGLVDWVMGTGQAVSHMLWVHASGSPLLTTNIGSDNVTVMERGANPMAWNVTQIATGRGPEGFDVSPDGREVWVAHSRDGGVSIIDLAQKKVTQTLDVRTKRSNRLVFTPDGRLVLISDLEAGDLVVMDAKARSEVKRLAVGRGPAGILVVPDGTRAYVALSGDDHLVTVDLRTLEVTGKIVTGKAPDGMAWVR